MRALGWLFAAGIAASLAVMIWTSIFSHGDNAESLRNVALLSALLFGIALGVVEHFGGRRNV